MSYEEEDGCLKQSAKWGYGTPLSEIAEARFDDNLSVVINNFLNDNCYFIERFRRKDWFEMESLKKLIIYIEYFMKIHKGVYDFKKCWDDNKNKLGIFSFLYDQQALIKSLIRHYKGKSEKNAIVAECQLVDVIGRLFPRVSEDLSLIILSYSRSHYKLILGEQLETIEEFRFKGDKVALLRSRRSNKLFVKDTIQNTSFQIISTAVWDALKKLRVLFDFNLYFFGTRTFLCKGDKDWFSLKYGETEFSEICIPAAAVFNDCLIDIEKGFITMRTPHEVLKFPCSQFADGVQINSADRRGIIIQSKKGFHEVCFKVQGKTEEVSFPEALECGIEKVVIKQFDEERLYILPRRLRGAFEFESDDYDHCRGRYFRISKGIFELPLFSIQESCYDFEYPTISVATANDDGSLVIGFQDFLVELVPDQFSVF